MRLNNNQRLLVRAGIAWAIYEAITAGFLIVFALALGASNTVVGIFGALPFLAVLLMEIPGAKLVEYFRRRTIFLIMTGLSRGCWLLILLTPYLFREHTLWFVGSFFFLMRCLEYTADPAWASLAADIVPDRFRGTFWGRRNMLISLYGMAASLLAGTYLDIFPKQSLLGFATLFGAGIIIGLSSNLLMSRIKEPEYRDHDHHCLKEFFMPDGQFRTYCFTMMAFNFAVYIASPFFTVYMLHNLGFSYTTFVIVGAIATISRILAQPHFGFVSDKYGDKPVALISMIGTAMVPLMYLFVTRQSLWLIVPAQIISGIAWAGTDLATWNLLLDLTSRQKRALQIAEYNVFVSIPMIIGPIVGGLIADNVKIILTGIPLLFAIATILRICATLPIAKIHETRAGREYPVREVISKVMTIHPLHGAEHAISVVVRRIKEEFRHAKGQYQFAGRVARVQPPKI